MKQVTTIHRSGGNQCWMVKSREFIFKAKNLAKEVLTMSVMPCPSLPCPSCHDRHAMPVMPCPSCHVRHAMSVMPCPSCHVRHAMSVMPCPSCHDRHAMSVMPCPSCHVRHAMSVMHNSIKSSQGGSRNFLPCMKDFSLPASLYSYRYCFHILTQMSISPGLRHT